MTEITASEYVKSQGLPSVAYVARKINKHPQRLFEWYHNNYALFEVVVAGVKSKDETDAYKRGAQAVILQEVRLGNFIDQMSDEDMIKLMRRR